MSLDQILAGVPENTEPTEPVEPAAPEPQTEPVEPPQGETPPATPPVAEPPRTVPLAALEDERRKRQALEQQLKQQTQPQTEQQKKGFWDDPEGHLSGVQQSAHLQALAVKLDITEEMARAKYTDYDDQLTAFAELVAENPNLRIQMLQARNPAEFAYSTAKNFRTVQEAGSVEGMRTKIEAEVRAKIEAEYKAKAEAEAKKRAAIPQTLTDVPSGALRPPEDVDDPPLDALVKKRE